MISETRFHCRSYAQRLMDSAEVVVHEIKGDHVPVVLKFLAEGICQARESAHSHSH